MYKVLKMFDDLLDPVKSTKAGVVYRRYEVGDVYPRKGYNPSASRILELGTAQNRLGAPLIELSKDQAEALLQRINLVVVEEPKEEEPKEKPKEESKEEKPKKKPRKKKTAKTEKSEE